MTDKELTKERNIYICFFIFAFVLSALFQHLRMTNILKIDENFQASDFHGYTIILSFLKGVSMYLVYRLSRFLKVSKSLTVLFCILAALSLLQFIPFVLLLAKVKSIRKTFMVPPESFSSNSYKGV